MLRFILVTLPLKRKRECWMDLVLQLQKMETVMFFPCSQLRDRIGDCAIAIPPKAENKAMATAFCMSAKNAVLILLFGVVKYGSFSTFITMRPVDTVVFK